MKRMHEELGTNKKKSMRWQADEKKRHSYNSPKKSQCFLLQRTSLSHGKKASLITPDTQITDIREWLDARKQLCPRRIHSKESMGDTWTSIFTLVESALKKNKNCFYNRTVHKGYNQIAREQFEENAVQDGTTTTLTKASTTTSG